MTIPTDSSSTEATSTPSAAGSAYANPALECDLVMKGGITSGVIYPMAVCELATVYRLRSVGGASAGAIAAAAAACAELGRDSGGFERLGELPDRLTQTVSGRDSRLFTLFQPQPRLRRVFALVTAGLGSTGWARGRAMVGAALRGWWLPTLLGAALGIAGLIAVVIGFAPARPAEYVALAFAVLVAIGGGSIGLLLGAVRDVRRIPASGFGLCAGNSDPDAASPAMTPWLHGIFQELAGRTAGDAPVTFGDLSNAGIDLQLMTTNLDRRQPMAMPWASGEYYFDPEEFAALFPRSVVSALERAAAVERPVHDQAGWLAEVSRRQAAPMLPFPAAADLPVLVAVRMSLSFPGLICAVPLHAVDYTVTANQEARSAATGLYDRGAGATPAAAAARVPAPKLSVNWFSDGGICANLPLQFFDSVLPRRPTFAIDLAAFSGDRHKSPAEADNSYLPTNNSAGLLRHQHPISSTGLAGLVGFYSAIIDTARSWVDESQLIMPGYRDRIVTVFHDRHEGGMNLNMDAETVRALSERGQGAAVRLVDRFAGEHPGLEPAAGWDNHRWLRFRTTAAAVSTAMAAFRSDYDTVLAGTTPYAYWIGIDAQGEEAAGPLPSYPMTKARRHATNLRTRGLLDTASAWQQPPADALTHGAPQPGPNLRLVPPGMVGAKVDAEIETGPPPSADQA